MDSAQDNKYRMFNSTAELLGKSTAIIAVIPAIPLTLADFLTQIGLIPRLAELQAAPTTGTTVDKDAVLATMAAAAVSVANGVKSYANKNHLAELAAKVDVKPSTFLLGREQDRITRAQIIHDSADAILDKLTEFGVVAADLKELQDAIDDARNALKSPRAAAGARKAATTQLADAFRGADDILINQLDPLVAKLAKKQPAFYAKYKAARVIIDRPGGHSTSDGTSGTPVPPAT